MPLALGLMSGTSCDGVSAALVEVRGRAVRVLAHTTTPYPAPFRQMLLSASSLRAPALSSLHVELGERFAQAALRLLARAKIARARVAVIGSHGHTIYHGPRDRTRSTLQLGAPAVIAERTGRPVVADFRARDMATGGEGAPLLPFFDQAVFGRGPVRAMQNIGGIANVAVVGRQVASGRRRGVVAFDTGPGNTLLDLMARRITGGRQAYDRDGALARQGTIDQHAIARLWQHPYFRRPPPKSTGLELFNDAFLRAAFGSRLQRAPHDVLATLTYFTAYSIVASYRRFVPHRIRDVVVSGGGARNRTLMQHLTRLLAPIPVTAIDRYGIPSQAKEPAAFAYLGYLAWRGRMNHLPAATGAIGRRILGSLTPGNPAHPW